MRSSSSAGNGRPLSFTTMWKAWRRLLRKADVPPLGVHAPRHTAATLLLDRGVDAKTVSEMLGHGSTGLNMTPGFWMERETGPSAPSTNQGVQFVYRVT